MILVLDTNVFVSACLGRGAASTVVATCLRGEHIPLMGAALMAEYEDVLGRTSLFKDCQLNASEREELLEIFLATCRWTRIYFGWRPNLKDEADNHLIELAIAGGASKVITANVRDFVRAELLFPTLQVLTAAQLLRETEI
jgi:putative PIN family toxin of toxin-antitoxin system